MSFFDIAISVALLLLTIAVVGLFAMMGELSSRVAASIGNETSDDRLVPLPDVEANLRRVPDEWPDELRFMENADVAVLLALSPLCASCNKIAPDLPHDERVAQSTAFGLIVSSSSREAGESFIVEHGLHGLRSTYVDPLGEWLVSQLALDTSPTVVIFRGGQVDSVYGVGSIGPLTKLVGDLEDSKYADVEAS